MRNSARISGLIAPGFYGLHRAMAEGRYGEYWLKGGRGSGKSTFAAV